MFINTKYCPIEYIQSDGKNGRNTHSILIYQSLMRQKPVIHFQDIFMLFFRALKANVNR